ncbi:hypothetical protein [Methanobacterium alcaliphilum]|uniref:hypothetical protein n=1 Tax=Methanobacterium alcaliphilum TaxID=392018 RepID=UPI00200B48D4|nr:hypothetical protein [Methanobacterium alcaliphilum]MCK9151379.1 hypothetical protein [Methanobacterium alcaliphilum]
MIYLICKSCGFTYELASDESIDDFISCGCGGRLYYSDDGATISKKYKKQLLDDKIAKRIRDNKFKKVDNNSNKKSFSTIFISAIIIFILIFIFTARSWRIFSLEFPLNIFLILGAFMVFFIGYVMIENSNLR